MQEFPETLPSNESMFATFIPARTPEFKVHRTEGLAHSALGQRSYDESYAKYEMKDGQWVKVFEYVPQTEGCGICGGSFRVSTYSGGYRHVRCESLSKAPRWKKKPICQNCRNTQRAQERRMQEEARDRAEYERLKKQFDK